LERFRASPYFFHSFSLELSIIRRRGNISKLKRPSYAATNGYFDLSKKPNSLSKTEHKKIQDIQAVFIQEAQKYRDPTVRKNNLTNFRELQAYMAELQRIVLMHWSHEELFR